MAEHSTPTDPPSPAEAPRRPLRSALTRWWSPAAPPAAAPVLGYESAQPWVLDDAADDTAGPERD